jgi:hypothetical protein
VEREQQVSLLNGQSLTAPQAKARPSKSKRKQKIEGSVVVFSAIGTYMMGSCNFDAEIYCWRRA